MRRCGCDAGGERKEEGREIPCAQVLMWSVIVVVVADIVARRR